MTKITQFLDVFRINKKNECIKSKLRCDEVCFRKVKLVGKNMLILAKVSSFYGIGSIVLLLGEVSKDWNVQKLGFRKLPKSVQLDRHL